MKIGLRWRRCGAVAVSAAAGALLTAAASLALAQAASAVGEVIKVDTAGARVTLKHSGVKALDMPPMTMAFRVREARLLDGITVGDRVRFAAERVDGQYQVTQLSRAP